MPLALTDYHVLIRDAALELLDADDDIGDLPWHAVEDLDAAAGLTAPCGVVCCIGPEQDRAELGTNQQDGIGFPVAVLLMATGAARGDQALGVPGLTLTGFRRVVKTTFHMKRLAGVPQVCWCEVSDSGPLVDDKSPLFQKLQTALVVTAVGRFPRS